MLNKQEMFTAMVRHLRKQGSRSTDGYQCCYRGPDGLKCAVGAVIPDQVYRQDMEGEGVNSISMSPLFGTCFEEDTVGLAIDMQECHDYWLPSVWEERFEDIASKHGLELPPKEVEDL